MRKFSAHWIFPVTSPPIRFGIVETDAEGTILRIRDTGGKPIEEAGLEFYNGIIVPGFVNAHCHLELSHLKGMIPEATGLTGFVTSVTNIRMSDPALINRAIQDADREMQAEGIVAAGDISNTTDTAEIKNNSPIRYHTFLEIFGLDPQTALSRFTQSTLSSSFFRLSSLSPHSPYSVGKSIWELLSGHPELTHRISIHHNESEEERQLIENRTGPMADTFREMGFDLSQIPESAANIFSLLAEYLPDSNVLLVHNLTNDGRRTTQMESATRHPSSIYYVLCPNSNLYIHNKLPDFKKFVESGVTVCLGTDSLASNHRLSILEEMRTVLTAAPEVPFATVLKWATWNGALALGMESSIGSMEPGKKPGLVHIGMVSTTNGKLLPRSRARKLI